MSDKPLVSIIVPTYNYGNYIPETLKNLLEQDYREIEIIVIDDGSTDDTKLIVAQFLKQDPRIKYYFQENAGLSAARNLGLRNATGNYIQFLDSDDLISPAKLSLQVKQFAQNKALAISYTNAYYFLTTRPNVLFSNLNLTDEEWMPQVSGNGPELLLQLIRQNIMPVNAPLIKKDAFIGVCFDTDFKSLEDWDIWLYLAFQNHYFQFLDDKAAYALIRVHENSMSQNRGRMFDSEINLRLKIKEYINASSILNRDEKNVLNLSNARRIKMLLSLIIRHNGFFKWNKLLQLFQKTNFNIMLESYLKAINDKRRHGS